MGNSIISLSGIDGSGKTTVIDGVRAELDKNNIENSYVWLRYNHYITKVLLVFCKLIGMTKYETHDGIRVGYHNFYKSKFISWLFICLTYIDTFIISWLLVRLPAIFTNKVIICDRWIIDILIDLEIDTHINLRGGIVKKLFMSLVPDSAVYIVISRDYESVLKARDEHAYDRNFKTRYSLYYDQQLPEKAIVVDNNGTVEETINKVTGIIRI